MVSPSWRISLWRRDCEAPFLERKCLAKELRCRTLPFLVIFNLLEIDFLVFILDIDLQYIVCPTIWAQYQFWKHQPELELREARLDRQILCESVVYPQT